MRVSSILGRNWKLRSQKDRGGGEKGEKRGRETKGESRKGKDAREK